MIVEIAAQLTNAMDQLLEMQPEEQRRPSPRDIGAFRKHYLESVDGEAAQMWELFSNSVESLLEAAGEVEPPS